MNNYIVKKCPHCQDFLFLSISGLNCRIYRHGVYKDSLEQIDPHMKKEECDRLVANDLIYGCAKPFKIIDKNKTAYEIIKCDYI